MRRVSFTRVSKEIPKKGTGSDKVVCATCRYALDEEFAEAESEYINPLSLDTLLVQHPAATYFIEVASHEGVSVQENKHLGIAAGDILTVDRALKPSTGKLALVVLNGEFSLCRLTEHKGKKYLMLGNCPNDIKEIDEQNGVHVWGVVSALSRKL